MPIFNMVGGGGYKSLGTMWVSRSTIPYDFYNGSAVVLNDEIHILGCDAAKQNHEACFNVYTKAQGGDYMIKIFSPGDKMGTFKTACD